MEEKISYGFFDQLPIAFFQPEKYKNFLPAKKKQVAGFVLLIVMLIFMMDYVIPFAAWDISVGGLENLVTQGIPNFTLKNGVFNIESPMDMEISGAIHVKADSSVENYQQKDLKDNYLEEFLISKNNIMMKHSSMVYEVKFDEMKDYTMDNQSLVELIPMAKMTGAMTFVLMFIMQLGVYLISCIFFAVLCKVGIRSPEGRVVRFGEALLFAIYGRSLFALLTSLNTCLGFYINSTLILVVSAYFTIRWIMRAERSLLGYDRKGTFKGNNGEE
ncbi:MAG: DUF1189 domain-containing protein [Eubacteriales bacterium]|nr:DUF1189 domain-containing protein [Eubacteriales bacterium]